MRIIIFGDSITQGFFDAECGGWANRLRAQTLRDAANANFEDYHSVYTLGISGDMLARLPERFDVEFNRRRSKRGRTLTLFAYGINDSMIDGDGAYATPPDDFKAEYASIIQKAKEAGSVMLVGLAPIDEKQLNPIPWHPTHSYSEQGRMLFDTAVQELAREHGCTFISMDGVFGNNVAGKTTDGIHPNAEGHQLMFERIRDALVKEDLL